MKDKFSTHILEPYTATIAEMSNSADGGDISIDVDKTKIDALLASDEKPMFVTLPVAVEGTSANGRIYTAKNIESIAEQINSDHPDGYAGHLTDDERKTKVPDAQTVWLGAAVTVVSRLCELEDLEGTVHDAAGLAAGFGDVTSAGEMVGADCEVAQAGHDAGS